MPPDIGATSSLALLDGGPNTAVLIPDNFNYTTDGSFGGPRLGQITVEAWVKPINLQLNDEDNRVVWDDYGNPGVLLSLQADGRMALSVSTDQHPPGAGLASGQVVINTWQHIAGVYDGTRLRIFINGQDTCVVTETSGFIVDQSSVFPGDPIRIGNTPGDVKSYEGLIDDVRVFPIALNRTQLAGGLFADDPPTPCGDGTDLAVTAIAAPKTVTLTAKKPVQTKEIKVEIQNRSPHPETIEALTGLVRLTVDPVGPGTCPDPVLVLHQGPPQKPLPLTLKSKKTLQVVFDVTFDCANDPAKGASHRDYRYTATVDHAALDGNPDTHPEDDSCPRDPLGIVPNPDGTIKDKGCAAEATDVVEK